MVISTRQRLLDAATSLVGRRGMGALTVASVAEAAHLSRAAVYVHFGSKEALVEATLQYAGAVFIGSLEKRLAACEEAPEKVLEATFDLLAEWLRERGAFGCPFVLAVGALGQDHDRVKAICSEQKQRVMCALERRLAQSGVEEAPSLAFDVMLLAEGATVLDSVGGETTAAQRAYRTALRLLED
jgi:AcrR family transcriptional regulator